MNRKDGGARRGTYPGEPSGVDFAGSLYCSLMKLSSCDCVMSSFPFLLSSSSCLACLNGFLKKLLLSLSLSFCVCGYALPSEGRLGFLHLPTAASGPPSPLCLPSSTAFGAGVASSPVARSLSPSSPSALSPSASQPPLRTYFCTPRTGCSNAIQIIKYNHPAFGVFVHLSIVVCFDHKTNHLKTL